MSSRCAEVSSLIFFEFFSVFLGVSAAGYVRCSLVGHDVARTVGLVGVTNAGKALLAGCHLQSTGDKKLIIAVQPLSKMRLASWLALGVPAPWQLRRAEENTRRPTPRDVDLCRRFPLASRAPDI